jgi:hypothetical protein
MHRFVHWYWRLMTEKWSHRFRTWTKQFIRDLKSCSSLGQTCGISIFNIHFCRREAKSPSHIVFVPNRCNDEQVSDPLSNLKVWYPSNMNWIFPSRRHWHSVRRFDDSSACTFIFDVISASKAEGERYLTKKDRGSLDQDRCGGATCKARIIQFPSNLEHWGREKRTSPHTG